ncbi:MAG TPA: radical SAM protein [Bacteroidales bacterium]|nr:radical SAM protein [Bacteroidales bacterium]
MSVRVLFIGEYRYFESLSVLSLASFIESNGHECLYLDMKLERNMNREIARFKPDIIAYSVTTGRHKMYRDLNSLLKMEFNFISVFGGPHCTFYPDFINENGVDVICVGEGEYALLELADCVAKNKSFSDISNLWVKTDEGIIKNELRPLIDDINSLPPPNRSLLDKYPAYKNKKQKSFMTGRGCPYKCTYCFNHVYNKMYEGKGSIIRKRSVSSIIDEISKVKAKYKIERIFFYDDIFTFDKEWLKEFCERYKNINISFTVGLRVNNTDEEIVSNLKSAGCKRVLFGIECGNEKLRNNILKRHITDEQIIVFTQLLRKYKIFPASFNMIGLPDETIENVFETIQLNIKAGVKFSYCTVYQPYPKTELAEYCVLKGYYNGSVEDIPSSYNMGGSPLKTPDIEQIIRLQSFFSMCITFPFLIPLVKKLIKLKLNKFYIFLFMIYRGFMNVFFMKDLSLGEVIKDIIATKKHPRKIYY